MTAHYTQVVWAQTRFVGCGRRSFRKGQFYVEHYVCNYGPTGNYRGEPLYLTGAPCSRCPEDSECTGGVLCVAGAGRRPDIYAYRYQHEPSAVIATAHDVGVVDLNVTSAPEDNKLYASSTGREEAGQALQDKWLRYVIVRYSKS
ncbi:hypothetical protein B7P43_G11879 [Cryptotermes secundus]|uniref:SCP domain-containing protein n=2 Tax=Cryptotermes secundus TaxID=105785 RepID=A0A2J7Q707_9NEOP|nr:hypothetical protein B7P43_G11879 [Cryptotermes secundus]